MGWIVITTIQYSWFELIGMPLFEELLCKSICFLYTHCRLALSNGNEDKYFGTRPTHYAALFHKLKRAYLSTRKLLTNFDVKIANLGELHYEYHEHNFSTFSKLFPTTKCLKIRRIIWINGNNFREWPGAFSWKKRNFKTVFSNKTRHLLCSGYWSYYYAWLFAE